jgi:hypothetical protein
MDEKIHFYEKSHECLMQIIFFKIKNASQNILQIFFGLRGFQVKCHFQYAFDENSSVTHVFIKQIFRAAEQAPPPPTGLCRGQGTTGWFHPFKQ